MDIPQELKEVIEKAMQGVEHSKIIDESQNISKKYRENNGTGEKLVTRQSEAIAYAISRMPATYCAVYSALSKILKNNSFNIKNILDVGAGTGSATWAIKELIKVNQIICLERENEMRKIGSRLMRGCEGLKNIEWKEFDITKDELNQKADLIVTSYCPHNKKCPINPETDWCSFYVRVSRGWIQRQAKNGELGYEDEKFSYIAVSKTPIKQENSIILRHPQIAKGYVKVKLCTKNGIEEKIYSKKDKEIYKKIRKLDAGDTI